MRSRAVIAATCLVVAILVGGCSPDVLKKIADEAATRAAEQRVDTEFVNDPAFAKALALMKARFPDDYDTLRSGLVGLIKSGQGKEAIGAFFFEDFRHFRARHTSEFVAAGSPALSAFRKAQIRWYEAVQRTSVVDCAWAMLPKSPHLMTPSGAIRQATGDLLYTVLNAAVDGKTARIHRTAPAGKTYYALGQAMVRQGLTPAEVNLVVAGRIDTLPPDRECAVGIDTFKAIDSLPEGDADKITTTIFAADTAAGKPAREASAASSGR